MVRIIITAAAVLAAVPAAAQVDEAAKARLITAIVAAGCSVTPDNNGAILSEAGLSEDEAAGIVEAMLEAEEAEAEDDVLVLKTGGCN